MSRNTRKPTMWILTRSDTNQADQPLEMARGLKFCIKEGEGLYYPSSENKGADQLRGYHEADLRHCFRILQNVGFLMTRLKYHQIHTLLAHLSRGLICELKVYEGMWPLSTFSNDIFSEALRQILFIFHLIASIGGVTINCF